MEWKKKKKMDERDAGLAAQRVEKAKNNRMRENGLTISASYSSIYKCELLCGHPMETTERSFTEKKLRLLSDIMAAFRHVCCLNCTNGCKWSWKNNSSGVFNMM